MAVKKPDIREGKMIHIRLPDDVHKRLRYRMVDLDTTMQDWVSEVVIKELDRQEKRKN